MSDLAGYLAQRLPLACEPLRFYALHPGSARQP